MLYIFYDISTLLFVFCNDPYTYDFQFLLFITQPSALVKRGELACDLVDRFQVHYSLNQTGIHLYSAILLKYSGRGLISVKHIAPYSLSAEQEENLL